MKAAVVPLEESGVAAQLVTALAAVLVGLFVQSDAKDALIVRKTAVHEVCQLLLFTL